METYVLLNNNHGGNNCVVASLHGYSYGLAQFIVPPTRPLLNIAPMVLIFASRMAEGGVS